MPVQVMFVLLGDGSFITNQLTVNLALSAEALGVCVCFAKLTHVMHFPFL